MTNIPFEPVSPEDVAKEAKQRTAHAESPFVPLFRLALEDDAPTTLEDATFYRVPVEVTRGQKPEDAARRLSSRIRSAQTVFNQKQREAGRSEVSVNLTPAEDSRSYFIRVVQKMAEDATAKPAPKRRSRS